MSSLVRVMWLALFILGIILLIEWGAWQNMLRMLSVHVRFPSIRRGWFIISAVQLVWFGIYVFRWSFWREHQPQYLLVTHAVLISLLVPKLWLAGTELLEGLRHAVQWILTSPDERPGIPRRTFITWSGQAAAGFLLGSFSYGMTRGRYGYHVRRLEVPFADLPAGLD